MLRNKLGGVSVACDLCGTNSRGHSKTLFNAPSCYAYWTVVCVFFLYSRTDTYFEGDDNVVAVFDYDYPVLESYLLQSHRARYIGLYLVTLYFASIVATFLSLPLMDASEYVISVMRKILGVTIVLLFCLPVWFDAFLLKNNVRLEAYSQHVCITRGKQEFNVNSRRTF